MKDTILSVIRHALTFGGGLQVARGKWNENTAQIVSGVAPALIGALWGAVDEYLAAKKVREEKANRVGGGGS